MSETLAACSEMLLFPLSVCLCLSELCSSMEFTCHTLAYRLAASVREASGILAVRTCLAWPDQACPEERTLLEAAYPFLDQL